MNEFKTKKISKLEFLKLKEENLIFITNPGRMGDEDGITFITKHNNEINIYRIDGLLYPKEREKIELSLKDIRKQFPKWNKTWKNSKEKKYKGKYKYLYMGFGNGLSIDNSIYCEFEPYLKELIKKYLKEKKDKDESLKYIAVYNVWKKAFINMSNNKGYIIK